jgi:predicted dehydrogenase/nucleoside-diphosphate-sugar epimerase
MPTTPETASLAPSTRARVRAGLVGAGYVSEFHLRALRTIPIVEVVGIVDTVPERARGVAERFSVPHIYPSLAAMAAAGVDVVHVLTPPESHADVTVEALRLGGHVLVEKPAATSVEECDRMEAEASRAGRVLCVNHSMLGDPMIRRALEAVRSGAVGDILTVDMFRSSVYPPYHGGPLPPQYRTGGYPFRDLGVHALYLLREFLGEIEDVQADYWSAGARSLDPNLAFDEWRAVVRCARGRGHVQLSWNVRPLQHLIIVQGTRGTLRVDVFNMFVSRRANTPLPKAAERFLNVIAESATAAKQVVGSAVAFARGRVVPYQGLHTFVREFYEALASGRPTPAPMASARPIVDWTERVARPADAAKAAAPVSTVVTSAVPSVVVTGANGLLGGRLTRRLLDDGIRVRAFVRRPVASDIANHPRLEVVMGELGDPAAVDLALRGASVVFHVGATMFGPWHAHESATVVGTRNVVEAALRHRVDRLVHVSSLSVLDAAGHSGGPAVTEAGRLEPRASERGFYTRAKLEAERIVRQAVEDDKLRAVIVRPGHIWTETGRLLSPAVGIRMGRRIVMLGDRTLPLPLVHVDDVVEGLILAARSPLEGGDVVHLVDDDPISRDELAALYRLGREPALRVVHVPMVAAMGLSGLGAVLARLTGRANPMSAYRLRSGLARLAFDCTRARRDLGWEPKIRSREALRRLLAG